MKRSTAILTILAAVALSVAATACDPQSLAATPSTPYTAAPPASATPGLTQPPTVAPSATPSGSGAATPAAGDTPTQTPPTPEPTLDTPGQPAAGDAIIITLDDEGKTIQMAVGESFLLKLGEQYDWAVTISDQSVVSRVKNIAVVRGAQGVYDALQAGTVTLTATGDPACRQSQPPCMMPSRLFTVTIVVTN